MLENWQVCCTVLGQISRSHKGCCSAVLARYESNLLIVCRNNDSGNGLRL